MTHLGMYLREKISEKNATQFGIFGSTGILEFLYELPVYGIHILFLLVNINLDNFFFKNFILFLNFTILY